MRRMLKELAFAAVAVGIGVILFTIESGRGGIQGFTLQSWGYPLPWHFRAEPDFIGFGPDVNTEWIVWGAFFEDLAFWLALPIAAMELSAHVAAPYVMRVLKLRREERRTKVTSAFGFVETPQ